MNKIGLVGYSCATGLGELNRQLARYLPITHWLVYPHRSKKLIVPSSPHTVCRDGVLDQSTIQDFVEQCDIILFCETPYYSRLTEYCWQLSKRVVCVPMQEWMPTLSPNRTGWPFQVTKYICPIKYTYDRFHTQLPCSYVNWPIDTNRFSFRERKVCNRFVFINGNGGYQNRKGIDTIEELIHLWPEIPLTVFSQATQHLTNLVRNKPNIRLLREVASNDLLYSPEYGDVLLCPHSMDGLALEPREAASAGMPIIVTDGPIWQELPAIARVKSTVSSIHTRSAVEWYSPDATDLATVCRSLLGQDISTESVRVREWAEELSWNILANKVYEEVVCSRKEE